MPFTTTKAFTMSVKINPRKTLTKFLYTRQKNDTLGSKMRLSLLLLIVVSIIALLIGVNI